MTTYARPGIAVFLAIVCAACTGGGEQQARERITTLQQQWVDAVAAGDVDTIVGLYAEDAWFLPAGSEALQGREEIRGWWQETLADPPWRSLEFGPTEIGFAEGGDFAYDVGSSRTTVAGEDGETVREGKYLVVWERVDGEWKVVADAFNGN